MALRVECYAGYRGEETLRRFFLEKRKVEVTEVLARWQEPSQRHFKVRGDDGGTYRLIQDVATGQWKTAV